MKKAAIINTILLFLLMFMLISFVLMLLWNWLMPGVFGFAMINYYQALGLLLMSKILFGGEGFYFKRKWKNAWGMHMQRKMESMSPEERELFRKKWEERCGKWKES